MKFLLVLLAFFFIRLAIKMYQGRKVIKQSLTIQGRIDLYDKISEYQEVIAVAKTDKTIADLNKDSNKADQLSMIIENHYDKIDELEGVLNY